MALKEIRVPLGMFNQQIKNLADGSAPTDAVTLQQMQAFLRGLDWKASVRAASTTNVTVATPGTSIDGVTLATGDRVLLKDQTTASQNGIYTFATSATPLVRAVDADVDAEVTAGMVTTSTEGSTNADKAWVLTTNDVIVVGTTALAFAQMGGGVAYSAGANGGLVLSSNAFSIVLDTGSGLVLGAGGIKIDRTVSGSKPTYAADCAATTNPQTFTHNLGTRDVRVVVYDKSADPWVEVDVDIKIPTGGNTVIVEWGVAPTAAQYRIVVSE